MPFKPLSLFTFNPIALPKGTCSYILVYILDIWCAYIFYVFTCANMHVDKAWSCFQDLSNPCDHMHYFATSFLHPPSHTFFFF